MKYVIQKKDDDKKLMYYNVKIDGLTIKPKNNVKNQSIKAGKVVLVDDNLKEEYIRKKINKKIDKIINFMLRILNEDGTSSDDTGMALDELNKLKGIVINKYREYMKESEYKSILAKLILIEDEFKKSYNEKIFMNYNLNNYYEEEISEGRRR